MTILSKPKEGVKESLAFALGLAFAYLVAQTVDPGLVDMLLNLTQTLVGLFLGARFGTKVGDAFATAKLRGVEAQANALTKIESPKP